MHSMKEIIINNDKKSENIIIEYIQRNKIYRGIKNLIIWIPIIWKDRQWDYNYILILLEHKLSLMEKHYNSPNICNYVGEEKDLENIKIAKEACSRLVEDNYYKCDDFKKEIELKMEDLAILFDIFKNHLLEWWD